jgi:hypothetical protein
MLLAALLCAGTFTAAQAAAPVAPAALGTMRKAFVAALARKDLSATVKLTSFPLPTVAYQFDPRMSAAQFRKGLSSLGLDDAGVQHCVANDPATFVDAKSASDKHFANSWNVDCNGSEYYFAQRGGAWLFIGYENINE